MEGRREAMLVIVGAGASYDCVPRSVRSGANTELSLPGRNLPTVTLQEARPPLTAQLVEPGRLRNVILERRPDARPVVDYLRRTLVRDRGREPADTLEAALARYDHTHGGADYQRHLAGFRFYLRDLLWACTDYVMSADLLGGITNYTSLVRHALSWCAGGDREVVFISFNYDLLLERALKSHCGSEPALDGSVGHDGRVWLLKPHGSAHYEHVHRKHPFDKLPEPETFVGQSVDLFERLHGSATELEVLWDAPHEKELQTQFPTVPALAPPVEGKSDLLWPDEQRAILERLKGSVTRGVVVGWRAAEEHFLGLLDGVAADDSYGWIVAGGGAGDTAFRLGAHMPSARSWACWDDGFDKFMSDRTRVELAFGPDTATSRP